MQQEHETAADRSALEGVPAARGVAFGLKALALTIPHVLCVYWVGRAVATGAAIPDLLLGAALGIALCDLVTLLVHWSLDNYFTPRTPVVGTVVHYFREHHVHPQTMFERGYVENNVEQVALALPFMLVWLPFDTGPVTSALIGVAGLMGCYISQIHKWAHMDDPPAVARFLQRARLIVDGRHHAGHHARFDRNYGLCAGWLDVPVARLRLLEATQLLIYLLTGHSPVNVESDMDRARTTFAGRVGRLGWRTWYQALAWYARRTGAEFHCMNWGFEDGTTPVPEAHQHERYARQLYARVVRGLPLEGRRLVEISSGRGGGLAFLADVYRPSSATGVDFVRGNTAASREAFADAHPGLRYVTADATATGLEAHSADVVVNVEASHCYPDFGAFLAEARRVLVPGGVLAITDFRPVDELAAVRRSVREAGFEVLEDVDITPHVLEAMRLDAPRRAKLVKEHSASVLHGLLLNFAGADESADTYRRMQEGRYVYFLMQLRRDAAP